MKENGKKQIPLRLPPALYNEIAAWAADDLRSVNGQIEYLLTECVKRRKKSRIGETPDKPQECASKTEKTSD